MAQSFHEISTLCPQITGWSIAVQIERKYKKLPEFAKSPIGMVVCDEKGRKIECLIGVEYVDHYNETLEEGNWVSIETFKVSKRTERIRATTHKYEISFLKETIVKKYGFTPRTFYNLTPFSAIFMKMVDLNLLAELVGCICDVQGMQNITGDPTIISGNRFIFRLRDARNNVLDCEASGKYALDFKRNYDAYKGKTPLIVALSWWKIERYFDGPNHVKICNHGDISTVFPNPNTPEVEKIKTMLQSKMDEETGSS